MTKAKQKAIEKELEKTRDRVLRAAITSLDAAEIDGDEPNFRERFMRQIHEVIEHEGKDMTVMAMANPDIPHRKKAEGSFRMAVAQLYLAALVELIVSGNAQWDDGTLLPAQFKNMIRNIMSRAKATVLDTGEEPK